MRGLALALPFFTYQNEKGHNGNIEKLPGLHQNIYQKREKPGVVIKMIILKLIL